MSFWRLLRCGPFRGVVKVVQTDVHRNRSSITFGFPPPPYAKGQYKKCMESRALLSPPKNDRASPFVSDFSPQIRKLEKAVAVQNSLLERFSGKFRRCWKLFPNFPAARNAVPAKVWALSGNENGCWKIGPAFRNAAGFSPPRPPQPS